MRAHKFKESWWTKGLTGTKHLGCSSTSQYIVATYIIVLVSLLQSNILTKTYLCGKFAQNMNITRTRQNKNYFPLMLRISQLPRNAMNVLQSHSKKYFSTKQLAEPELSWELRTWEFFSINKASIQVKQNTNFSENKYPSYTQTWFLFSLIIT